MKELGEKILQFRKKNKLKQDDIFPLLKVSRATYINYEKGRQAMPLDKAIVFCDIIGITLNDLVSGVPFQAIEPETIQEKRKLRLALEVAQNAMVIIYKFTQKRFDFV